MPLPAGRGFGGGSGLEDTPLIQINFADLGAGVVSILMERGGISATYTRATAAATKLSSGLWKLDVASGSARSIYGGFNTTVPNPYLLGYYAEGAATQLALNPRDMTQAIWVAVTMTTAQTSTGIDGVGNSCTRVTAAGANSTILQTLVAAASSRTYSCWIKRITGTGTVILKHGTATLDITALINSATFTRVELNDNELNVAYGLQINTSGDALDVDCNQFEAGAIATSPIPAAGTRNTDILRFTGLADMPAGTLLSIAQVFSTLGAGNQNTVQIDDGTSNERVTLIKVGSNTNSQGFVVDGGVQQAAVTLGGYSLNVTHKHAIAWTTNSVNAALDGVLGTEDLIATMPTTNALSVACDGGGTSSLYGAVSRIVGWAYPKNAGQLIAVTAP